ncbi:hypothetical protein BHM03_00017666 [Ensete ventricosum]|nr:hypothetical protein BHM03_00017666 [Ensete ventricosum]
MHPLRLPNSGIRAKVYVMRLNHVESFNAFATRTTRRRGWSWLAARGSRLRPRPPARGRLTTTNHHLQGRPVAAKAPLQGATARRANSQQGAATRGRGRPARAIASARKGRPPAASPQEATHDAPARGYRQQERRRRP